jgi:shikimate O-hydroxycinnamoyltransferase
MINHDAHPELNYMERNKEKTNEMKNEIISSTCIKPSSPTPPHLKSFKLSFLDQLQPAIHGNMTFFFLSVDAPIDLDLEFSRKSKLLKKYISETLTRFYPLAERLVDDFTIGCNDDIWLSFCGSPKR